jgi:uncharacterized membrane protein
LSSVKTFPHLFCNAGQNFPKE